MRVRSYTTDEASLENKARDPSNSATIGYSLTAFSVPLRPRPLLGSLKRNPQTRYAPLSLCILNCQIHGTPLPSHPLAALNLEGAGSSRFRCPS
jgi:hypothetical protein